MNLFARLQHADPDTSGGAVAEIESNEPADMDATIGALFDKMQERGDQDAEREQEESASEEPQPSEKASPSRDPSGKFSKSAPTPETGDAKPGKDATVAVTGKAEEARGVVVTQFADAPKSWNATERAAWATIPEAARAAAHRREEDFHRGIQQYREKASTFDALDAVIRPHAEILKANGQNAVENVGALLNLQQVLYSGSDDQKIGTLLQIVEQSGIKPEALIHGLQNPSARPAQDPRYDSLARELQQTRQMLSEIKVAPVMTQVESFLADPKNEFVNEPGIAQRIEIELKNGAKDLQEAYDNACWADRNVRAKIQQKSAEAERKAQAERDAVEAKRKADLAAKARQASSINVKPKGVTAGPAAKGTMDDTIAALYDAKFAGR